jgi:hypothetical protein
MQEKAKELSKKRYTYDFQGNLLFMKKLNGDRLPKNSLNLPYTWHRSEQEVKAIEEKERKRKEAARFIPRTSEKPKTPRLFNIPQAFSKPTIASKYEYIPNGNFDKMKPKIGVKLVQNRRMKKSSLTIAESEGKFTRTDYYERISQMRTINTPNGIITSKDGEMNFFKTTKPQNDDFIQVQDLEEYSDQRFLNIEAIDMKYQIEPDRYLSSIASEGKVRIINSKAIKDMIFNAKDRDIKLSDADFSKTYKSIK